MKKTLLLAAAFFVGLRAVALNVNDYYNKAYSFDDFDLGHSFVVLSATGDTVKDATAVVELKAGSQTDKVLHVKTPSTAGFVLLETPNKLSAVTLLKCYSCIQLDIMRASDASALNSCHFVVRFDKGSYYVSYQDSESQNYNLTDWTRKRFNISATKRNSLKKFMWIGLDAAGADYLVDNVYLLKSETAIADYEAAKLKAVQDSLFQIDLARRDSIMAAESAIAQAMLPDINKNMDVKLAYDFDDYALGTTFPVYDAGKSTVQLADATATVVLDPKNSGNKVLYVTGPAVGKCYVELGNPDGLSAAGLLKKYRTLSMRIMRTADYVPTAQTLFNVMWGGNEAYGKALPNLLENAGTWYTETFAIALKKNSLAKVMRIGFNLDGAGYYIDDIKFPELEWTSGDQTKTVRYWASKLGKNFGTCLGNYSRTTHGTMAITNFNMLTCENEMKFDATEPSRGNFSYANGQAILNIAQANGMKLRGHTLCWHSQVPSWVTNFEGTRKEWEDILKNHIYNVAGHWKGQIAEWDVVNECLEENVGRQVGAGYQTRTESVWYRGFGDDSYIDSAFIWAHQADPSAKLYINDYNIGHWSNHYESGKTHAMYNMVKRMLDDGIPIDGVGLQMHTSVSSLNPAQIEETVKQFRKLGMNVIITEMDVPGGVVEGDVCTREISDEELATQTEKWAAVADILIRYDNCPSFVIWGMTDNNSWLDGSEGTKPLLFFADRTPHQAYIEIRKNYQRWALIREATAVEDIMEDSDPTWVDSPAGSAVYSIQGVKVMESASPDEIMNLPEGLYIIGGKKYYIH